jgi:pimeloyl-ACP methyl ester carboxylesterase
MVAGLGTSRLVLLGLALLAAACATPVGVQRVDTQTAYRLRTESAVATARPSEASLQVLRRFDLERRFEEDPAGALAALRRDYVEHGGDDRLFALAELSFLDAQRRGDRSTYLAAAVYAYGLLFPGEGRRAALDPSDPRLRLLYDFYNLGLAEGLRRAGGEDLDLSPGARPLPWGVLDLTVEPGGLIWLGYRLERFVPSVTLTTRGLRNRYRLPGVGTPLVASLAHQEVAATVPGARRIGPGTKVTVTAFLRLPDPRPAGLVPARLELYPLDHATTVRVDGADHPLESDATATLALWLDESPIWEYELRSLVRPGVVETELIKDRAPDGLFLLQPYRADRIPLVLVHGTASSPARWAELVNELRGDPRIRDRYQIWLFVYDTGNPIAYSAGRLRQALENTVRELDPTGAAAAVRRMVVIGHSQGGLLAKLTVVESGTRFWDNVSSTPFEAANLEPEVRRTLRSSLFFTPEPSVARVIFMATPHQGSYVAGPLAQLMSRIITLPVRLVGSTLDALTQVRQTQILERLGRLPTSIDNMSPGHPFIRALAALPLAPGVAAHSIIAVAGDGPAEDGRDGVVAYRSAHIDGVVSELVVRSGHSVQAHPAAIEEIRRILLEHAAEPR